MLYLTLRHYEYVVAIAQHGSFSAAAEALHVSQPALSTALIRIEAQVGKTLFLRKRGAAVVLTPDGRRFSETAQRLLEQAARLEQQSSHPDVAQDLVIGCFSDLAPFVLAPLLQELRTALPNVAIKYRIDPFEPLLEAMSRGDLDMTITYDLGIDAHFHRSELCHQIPVALMPPDHPLAQQSEISLDTLADHPLILSQEGLSIRHMLSLFKSIGRRPRIAHRSASLELLRSLAAHNEGVGLTYSCPAHSLTPAGKQIVAVPIVDSLAVEPIVAVTHTDATKGSLIDTVQEIARSVIATTITNAQHTDPQHTNAGHGGTQNRDA
ncbi:LysR family transcriptional regulator [Phaeobacter sp.]|uniref:LysR family transcriptional regulator n=1 Tax=Phaeobacter sp. TaxID=1902409 RepID=UPI0025D015CB|nr:LysR family transcriptional regulator [Phaeobacter sp.]